MESMSVVAGGQQMVEEPKGILCGGGNVLYQDGGYLIVYICQNYFNRMLKIDPLPPKKYHRRVIYVEGFQKW